LKRISRIFQNTKNLEIPIHPSSTPPLGYHILDLSNLTFNGQVRWEFMIPITDKYW